MIFGLRRFIIVLVLLTGTFFDLKSQSILKEIKKYDLGQIENQVRERAKKKLKITNTKNLLVTTYFKVGLLDYFHNSSGTVSEFLENFKLQVKYTESFVYNDSLRLISIVTDKLVMQSFIPKHEFLYLKYFNELKPEWIFKYVYAPTRSPMYFCYKKGDIFIVYLSDDISKIISYPLKDLKDWTWLN